jgi:hypothetical protein
MEALRLNLWKAILAIPLVSLASLAQEQSGGQATSSDRPIDTRVAPAQNKANSQDQDASVQKPSQDASSSLTGAEEFSLGPAIQRRSFWQPLFSVTSTVDTNPLTTATTTQTRDVTTWSSAYAGIDVNRISRRSDLTLSYLGGGLISNDGSAKNSVVQQFGLGEKLALGRSTFSLFDVVNQLPETSFGFSLPGSSVRLPGGQGLSLEPIFTPNQSILTTRGQRVGNATVLELDRALTSKSSLTFVGGYSLLRFLDNAGFLDFSEVTAQGGYDRQVTRHNSVALLYRFSELRFSGTIQPIDAHTAQLSFGRRDGRFAFRLAGGPAVSFFQTASPAGSSTPTSSSRQVYWTLDTSTTYQTGRTVFGLTYDRSLSGGAGILPGAITDQVSGSFNSQFSKVLIGGMSGGYARNKGLISPLTPTSAQLYNYWFGRVNLSHPWGRWTTLDLSYQVQFQDSNGNFCIGASCGTNLVRQTGSIGFNWRSRPIPIE